MIILNISHIILNFRTVNRYKYISIIAESVYHTVLSFWIYINDNIQHLLKSVYTIWYRYNIESIGIGTYLSLQAPWKRTISSCLHLAVFFNFKVQHLFIIWKFSWEKFAFNLKQIIHICINNRSLCNICFFLSIVSNVFSMSVCNDFLFSCRNYCKLSLAYP